MPKVRAHEALTFDDVLLVPRRSQISSRHGVDTSTRISRNIRCRIPILSANMDTVTEAAMAVAMARAGGIGIIHRFLSPDRQAQEVARGKRAESRIVTDPLTVDPRVKRAESLIVTDPVTVDHGFTLEQAQAVMREREVGGLVVLDGDGRVVGILTRRDMALAPGGDAMVADLMTPRERLVTAPTGIHMDEARALLHKHRLEKLPLVTEDGRLAGLITSQDILRLQSHPQATKDDRGRLRVGAAVGVRSTDIQRAEKCLAAGADLLVIDIAHGHSSLALDMVKRLKTEFPQAEVMAGNVATPEGVQDLADAGADAVKVGVGSGSICITRVVTGSGYPQLSAILESAEVARRLDVPLVSDGGVRVGGDISKALAAGASSVMVGSLLAGTTEAPGASVIRDGRRYKVVRGMASLTANVSRQQVDQHREVDPEDWEKVVPEGVEATVPYRGDAQDVLYQLVGGLRSGMTYVGASTIEEMWEHAEFVRITGAGFKESGSHDVQKF